MRPSRNRNWGHPQLVRFIERFAENAKKIGSNGAPECRQVVKAP
jgi:penicillin-insensitive murein endopeptidase